MAPTVISTDSGDEDKISATWSVPNAQLQDILDSAWIDLSPDTEEIIGNINMLPQILHSNLPYKDRLGNDHLLIDTRSTCIPDCQKINRRR